MNETHDEHAAVQRDISDLLSDKNLDAHRVSASIAAAVRKIRGRLAAESARAEKAEAEVERLRRRDAVQTEAIRAAKGFADCYQQLAEAADAAPEALSATEMAAQPAEGSGVELEFGKRVTGPSELARHDHDRAGD